MAAENPNFIPEVVTSQRPGVLPPTLNGRGRFSRSVEDNNWDSSNILPSDNDPLALYLRGISKTPLLTARQEVNLAIRIERGGAAQNALEQNVPDQEERARLQRVVERGNLAKQELIEANLRLVVSVAKRYIGRGLYILDLIQEGNIGLERAVEKFDYTLGFKFSTYAHYWIRQAISRAIAEQARTIRLPVNKVESVNTLLRVDRQLEQEYGRLPTTEEIGQEMNITPDQAEEIKKASLPILSLETPKGADDEDTLQDFIADQNTPDPFNSAYNSSRRDAVDEVLDSSLTTRENGVLQYRYGLVDGRERTLQEVSEVFGVTRERIRQIEADALRKLRHPSITKKLKHYLD